MFQPAEFSTTLASAASSGATSFTVASSTGLPALTTGDISVMRLDDGNGSAENVLVTAISGTTVTCAALANSHSSGATVKGAAINTAALAQIKRDALAMGPEVAITSSGTATLGKMHRCAPTSANITLAIPNGTVEGDMVSIRLAPSATKLVTLTTSAGIDGATSRVMWRGESAYLRWDTIGSTWTKVAGRTIPMMAAVNMVASGVSIPDNTPTPIPFDHVLVDNTGAMAEIANSRIRVLRSGVYRLKGCVGLSLLGADVLRVNSYPTLNGSTLMGTESPKFIAGNEAACEANWIQDFAANDLLTLVGFINSATGATETFASLFFNPPNLLEVVEQAAW